MSLLEQAKKFHRAEPVARMKEVTNEEIELCIAVIRGEISIKQASQAAGFKVSSWQAYCFRVLTTGVRDNRLREMLRQM